MIHNIWFNKKKTESTGRWKIIFLKQIVENADLDKPISNKIMTTQEQCIKYDFVAPLM